MAGAWALVLRFSAFVEGPEELVDLLHYGPLPIIRSQNLIVKIKAFSYPEYSIDLVSRLWGFGACVSLESHSRQGGKVWRLSETHNSGFRWGFSQYVSLTLRLRCRVYDNLVDPET